MGAYAIPQVHMTRQNRKLVKKLILSQGREKPITLPGNVGYSESTLPPIGQIISLKHLWYRILSKQWTDRLSVWLKNHDKSVAPHPNRCLHRLITVPTTDSRIRPAWPLRVSRTSLTKCIAEKADNRAWGRTTQCTSRQEQAVGGTYHGVSFHRTHYLQPCRYPITSMRLFERTKKRKTRRRKRVKREQRENKL